MKLIETATGHNVASNYGDHNLHKVTKVSEPFFNDKTTFDEMRESGSIGPFIADAGGKKMTRAESGYVITKTHCGGYCFKCAPEKYTISDAEFLKKCASGGWVYNDKKNLRNRSRRKSNTIQNSLIAQSISLEIRLIILSVGITWNITTWKNTIGKKI